MKVLVPVKRVIDGNVHVRLRSDQSGIDFANAKMSMNPFDEIAVEEAVRLKECGKASEILVVSIGSDGAAETIRTALAMGADRGLLVKADGEIEPLAVAKILKAICDVERPHLVLTGKQAIDDDAGQVGPMLAALCGWAQATQACKLDVEETQATVECETDRGMQTVVLRLPAVVTAELRLNEPRYTSLPNIMKARKKPIAEMNVDEFSVDVTPRVAVMGLTEAPVRAAGVKVSSVSELLDKLQEKNVI